MLTEGDDQQDPVADSARAILDGHIVLSRSIAEKGHYPAIDIEQSISRVMPHIVSKVHLQTAQRFKQLFSKFNQNQDLITIGAYTRGSDPELDMAIERMPKMNGYLQQGLNESFNYAQCEQGLMQLFASQPPAPAPTARKPMPKPSSRSK